MPKLELEACGDRRERSMICKCQHGNKQVKISFRNFPDSEGDLAQSILAYACHRLKSPLLQLRSHLSIHCQHPHPPTSYLSLRANRKPRERSAAATDAWYCCRSSDSELRPTDLPSLPLLFHRQSLNANRLRLPPLWHC